MKKLIICAMALALAIPGMAQSGKKPGNKSQKEVKTEDQDQDNDQDKPKTKLELEKEKREKEKKAREEKLKESREKAKQKLEEDKEKREKAKEERSNPSKGGLKVNERPEKTTPDQKSKGKPNKKEKEETSGSNEPVVGAGNVLTYYQQLPIAALPQLQSYIDEKNAEDPTFKVTDTKDLRKGFVREQNLPRGFLNLQRPGQESYTRVQSYKDETGKPYLLVETSDCGSSGCHSIMKFYERNGSEWQDVTDKYMPQIDYKATAKRLKEEYKKQYLDLDLYETRGYDDPEKVKEALNYTISPEDNKVLIRETYIPFVVYEMTWNESKKKFELKKK